MKNLITATIASATLAACSTPPALESYLEPSVTKLEQVVPQTLENREYCAAIDKAQSAQWGQTDIENPDLRSTSAELHNRAVKVMAEVPTELSRRGFSKSEINIILNNKDWGIGTRKAVLDCRYPNDGWGPVHASSYGGSMYQYDDSSFSNGYYVWFNSSNRVSDWSY